MTILEPSFETVSNWTFSTECDVHYDNGGTKCSGSVSEQSSDWASDGTKSFKGYVKMAGADGWSKAIASQANVDFSDFDGIKFDWKVDGFGKDSDYGYDHKWNIQVYKDDTQLGVINFQFEDSGSTGTSEIDCSGAIGVGTLKIIAQVYINSGSATDYVEGTFYVDNIILSRLKTSTSNSRLIVARDKSANGNSYIDPVGYISYDAKSNIIIQQEKNIIGKSRISILQEKNIIGSAYILFDYTAPERIVIETSDPIAPLRNAGVGDLVTVNDPESGLSGTYRIYGKELRNDSGLLTLSYELSNTQLSVMGEIKKSADQIAKLDKYMQGSTNLFVVNETENAENGKPIDIFFNIPKDAIAINSIKLSYRNEAPRVWSSVTENNSAYSGNDWTYMWGTSGALTSSNTSDILTSQTIDSDTSMCIVYWTAQFSLDTTEMHDVYISANDGTNSYLTSVSSRIRVNTGEIDSETITGSIVIPGNLNGKTITVSISCNVQSGKTLSYYSEGTIQKISRHTHNVSYDIGTKTYTTTSIDISYTNDASVASPTWTSIETDTTYAKEGDARTDFDITQYFSGQGWKGIRIAPNGNSRHKVQVQIKCFVQSRI